MNTKDKVPCALVGEDGNAFAIIGRVTRALRKHGRAEYAAEFQKRAMSGDYEHLLAVALEYTREPTEDDDA